MASSSSGVNRRPRRPPQDLGTDLDVQLFGVEHQAVQIEDDGKYWLLLHARKSVSRFLFPGRPKSPPAPVAWPFLHHRRIHRLQQVDQLAQDQTGGTPDLVCADGEIWRAKLDAGHAAVGGLQAVGVCQ